MSANNVYTNTREAVRVKVKKCELNNAPEWRKFSVDPQITTLDVLYSLLVKAFDVKSDFSIKYKAFDPAGNEIYLAVLSDWDLDAAFLRIHNMSIQTNTEPCLILQIDIKPFTEVKEWDALTSTINTASSTSSGRASFSAEGARDIMSPLQQSLGASQKYVQNMQTKLPGLIMNQMEKTFSMVQKAFNLSEETMASLPPRPALSDSEFRLFLDALGQIQRSDELRKVIFFGGIDSSLRRVVWKHILNVYPSGMNGHQRMDYMRRKSEHYYKLREIWKTAVKQGCVVGELSYVTSMVKKDVLRTDRPHPFYAGSDDNQNIASLFNILTTYALNHPSVSYCQGMSDIASPLLVTMNDEAQAYICFCAIMTRVKGNFMLDGIAMTQKFGHLTEALSYYDPDFWEYLKSQQADDLLFCYRWLLLELKREFPFEDALRMLEVQWSSLKYENSVDKELSLFEKEFVPIMETSAPTTSSSISGSSFGVSPMSPSFMLAKQRENPYTKVCALRRQSSSASLNSLSSSLSTSSTALNSTRRLNQSVDENNSLHFVRRHRRTSSKAYKSMDETKMLMLMEQMETVKDEVTKSNEAAVTSHTTEDADDDVFMTTESHNKTNHFNFHPTNPFMEDALTDAVEDVKESPNKDNSTKISKAFLSDSSSPIPEDECGDGNGVLKSELANIPKSIAKLHNKNIISNYNAVSSIITKQLANVPNVGESAIRVGHSSGGHFRDLKEKIAATSRKGLSFDESINSNDKTQQKLVKNFNEFLNFAASSKNRIADKFANSKVYENDKYPPGTPSPSHCPQAVLPTTTLPQPLVKLTTSGFASSLDESDSSSVPDTTWSGSTAATAIQQLNNWSNHSLHLETLSISSASHTPERTPTTERNLVAGGGEKLTICSPLRSAVYDASVTPDDSQDQEYYPMTTAKTRELRLEAENLDRQVFGELEHVQTNDKRCNIEYEQLGKDTLDLVDDLKENEIVACPDVSELLQRRLKRDAESKNAAESSTNCRQTELESWQIQMVSDNCEFNSQHVKSLSTAATSAAKARTSALANSFDALKSNPFVDKTLLLDASMPSVGMSSSTSLPEVLVAISTDFPDTSPVELATNAADEIAFADSDSAQPTGLNGDSSTTTPYTAAPTPPILPPPSIFGGGNPFLIFLCLTLLLQHRGIIMKTGMDYNEIAMHFDKMVRKHDVTRVLNQARRMYIDYLKVQNAYNQRLKAATLSDSETGDSHEKSNAKTSAQEKLHQQQHQFTQHGNSTITTS